MKKAKLFEEFEHQYDNKVVFLSETKNADTPLHKWLEAFDAGKFEPTDVQTQIGAGWYDWFCKDSSLANKTKTLGAKLKTLLPSPKIDQKSTYVFFKNNCPMNGTLYDDFRICDIKTGDVIWTITPRVGHKSADGAAEVWGKENSFDGPIVHGTWKDVVAFFKGGAEKPAAAEKEDPKQAPEKSNEGNAGKNATKEK